MLLTKNYFKNFPYVLLVVCILSAILVGSIQTGYIVYNVKKGAKKNV